jgi:hypothetical protein
MTMKSYNTCTSYLLQNHVCIINSESQIAKYSQTDNLTTQVS